jgi:hypothetical protein
MNALAIGDRGQQSQQSPAPPHAEKRSRDSTVRIIVVTNNV